LRNQRGLTALFAGTGGLLALALEQAGTGTGG
jgi:hypothetical protein